MDETDSQTQEAQIAAPEREFEAGSGKKLGRWWTVGGLVALGLVGAAALWSMPGAAALEGTSTGELCVGGLPSPAGEVAVVFASEFTNHSSLPVTVTDARVGQLAGLKVVGIHAVVGDAGVSAPEISAGANAAQAQAELQGVTSLGAGAQVRVESGQSVNVTFVAEAADAAQPWGAQAANIEVDFHAWTHAPQSSTSAEAFSYTSGTCEQRPVGFVS